MAGSAVAVGADGVAEDDPKLNAGLGTSAVAAFGTSALSPPKENGLAAEGDAAGSATLGAPN